MSVEYVRANVATCAPLTLRRLSVYSKVVSKVGFTSYKSIAGNSNGKVLQEYLNYKIDKEKTSDSKVEIKWAFKKFIGMCIFCVKIPRKGYLMKIHAS